MWLRLLRWGKPFGLELCESFPLSRLVSDVEEDKEEDEIKEEKEEA